jgi:Rod binding domain-containing protein
VTDVALPTNLMLPRGPLDTLLASAARPLGGRPDRTSAEQAAKDFESVLLYKLLEEMKRTIPRSELVADGVSDQVRDLFWYYLAQDLADKGGLGLWKELYQQMNPAAGPSGPGLERSP